MTDVLYYNGISVAPEERVSMQILPPPPGTSPTTTFFSVFQMVMVRGTSTVLRGGFSSSFRLANPEKKCIVKKRKRFFLFGAILSRHSLFLAQKWSPLKKQTKHTPGKETKREHHESSGND